MSAILIITAKGVSPTEVNKNFNIVDSAMSGFNDLLYQISDKTHNPRVYYTGKIIETKKIHDLIKSLRENKEIHAAVRQIEYSSNLNKM